ncbi:DUF4097 family beta strand repeat-containing protein [Gulosibacter sp. 10]|uniref:DUF4097 family beta strand repeat-containing protein n=1 Tax=Gulosibacter sp. 10 TaxID=1255570 RepID=UPI00097EAC8B|nr:DUF4097 family beta strand repeat-containing protein [Gulosibacter sp. 10]SJM64292.1 hypothetical protein FM112_10045 [Gulosibacter sp. 10]
MAIEQWHVDAPKTIDLELVRHVRVNLMGGSCNIIAHDLPSARVEVSAITGRDMKIAIDGDTLLIDHPQLGWNSLGESARTLVDQPRATVSVLVPKSVGVNVKSTSADILVVGVDGDISITTVGGEHFMDDTAGKLSLTSGGGELSVRGHRGSVDARTATGDVTVTGPITRFDGNTISGSTVVDVSEQEEAPAHIANASVSGATTVRLPEHANASFQVTTVAGKAQLGEEIIDPLYGKQLRRPAADEDADVTEVRLSTVAGRITVLGGGAGAKAPADAGTPGTATEAPESPAAPTGSSVFEATAAGTVTDTGAAGGSPDAEAPYDGAAPAEDPDEAASESREADRPETEPSGTDATGPAEDASARSAAWRVDPNPNVDFSQAPHVEGSIVPPQRPTATEQTPPPPGTHLAGGQVPNAPVDGADGPFDPTRPHADDEEAQR